MLFHAMAYLCQFGHRARMRTTRHTTDHTRARAGAAHSDLDLDTHTSRCLCVCPYSCAGWRVCKYAWCVAVWRLEAGARLKRRAHNIYTCCTPPARPSTSRNRRQAAEARETGRIGGLAGAFGSTQKRNNWLREHRDRDVASRCGIRDDDDVMMQA